MELTQHKERRITGILFVVLEGILVLLTVTDSIQMHAVQLNIIVLLQFFSYAAVAVGLLFEKSSFLNIGVGFGVLALLRLIIVATSIGYGYGTLRAIADLIAFAGLAAASLICFMTRFGNEKQRILAKKLTPVPLVCLLVAAYDVIDQIVSAVIGGTPRFMTILYIVFYAAHAVLFAVAIYPAVRIVADAEVPEEPDSEDEDWKAMRKEYRAALRKKTQSQKAAAHSHDASEETEATLDITKHVLLLFLTFGVWYYIWVYRTTRYTNRIQGEEERNLTKELLLCIFVPFYEIYWVYKTAQRIDALAAQKQVPSDIVTTCVVLAIFVGLVPPIIMQDKINAIELHGTQKEKTATQPKPAQPSLSEELRRYKDLLDAGLITQSDYEKKKEQLLGL